MWAFLLLGVVYTQLFEYWYHAVPMHRGLPLLDDIRRNHLEHHRLFHGHHFRTRDPADTWQIPGRWWAFPAIFFVHYALLSSLFETGAVVFFLLGTVSHYLVFEITHWFTHVEDNAFDRFLERIPFLGELRAHQIEHHRIHHEIPVVAFNFNPPYLGDRLTVRMPQPAGALWARARGGGAIPGADADASGSSRSLAAAPPLRHRLRLRDGRRHRSGPSGSWKMVTAQSSPEPRKSSRSDPLLRVLT